MVGGNLEFWKSKRQPILARSSSEAKYQANAHRMCEILWLRILLYEVGIMHKGPMVLHYRSTSVQNSATKVFHECEKHMEVEYISFERRLTIKISSYGIHI